MPRIVVDLDANTVRRIKDVMRGGSYGSVQEFIWVSLENQISLETSTDIGLNPHMPPIREAPSQAVSATKAPAVLSRPSRELKLDFIEVTPSPEPLWGMYYRFLPLKVAVRGIANLGNGSASNLLPRIGEAALDLGERLREFESLKGIKRGYGNSQGLPGRRNDTGASIGRFLSMYVGRVVRRDNSVTGMMHNLGFGSIADKEGTALSQEGFRFAELKNPALDENFLDVPLGGEEKQFLLSHIEQTMAGEYGLMREYYRTLLKGAVSPRGIAGPMHTYIRAALPDPAPSNSVLETMTSGVQSRMIELGLVLFSRLGPGSRYSITEQAREFFEGV